MEATEISLFPIPGSVSVPYTTVPLHIFEPRYRKMVADSIENKRRIGVAHTKRVIAESKSPPDAALEEALKHNHETYEAFPVFSAGFAEIRETLPDGRLLVEIKMDSRYEIIDEVQDVPYKVVRCKPYVDEEGSDEKSQQESEILRKELDHALLSLNGSALAPLRAYVKSPEWRSFPLHRYSFAIYSLVIFEPDVLQKVLELKSTAERIGFLLDMLGNKVWQ